VPEKLQLLRDLQDIDLKKLEVDQQRQKGQNEKETLHSEVARLQDMVDSLANDISALEAEKKELKMALSQEQQNIERSESRLPQIKTQKEYVAVLKEIDTAKKLSKELDTQISAKDEALAGLNNDKAEKDAELEDLSSQAKARCAEIDERLAVFEAQLAEMKSQRETLLKELPTSLRKRYDLLLSRRGGLAVVEARSGACLGCNMHLPPQLFNSLLVAEDIQACPHCNRLLFVDDKA
jgi:predicted  nucleic acid-binding Zn-ribbon protein